MSVERTSELRTQILELVGRLYEEEHAAKAFIPGETLVPVSGRVYDDDDLLHLVDASLDFWLTTGRYAHRFEREFARVVGTRHALLCNSGSSANLLALTALTSPKLGAKRLQPGDEVITVAAGFPTTVNPIILNRLVPVFVDVELETYNVDVAALEEAISPRTRAIMIAHTLGNPFDLDAVTRSLRSTASGSSRTTATRSGRSTTASRRARSAAWRRSASIPPITSRWARAAPSSPTGRT